MYHKQVGTKFYPNIRQRISQIIDLIHANESELGSSSINYIISQIQASNVDIYLEYNRKKKSDSTKYKISLYYRTPLFMAIVCFGLVSTTHTSTCAI